jgi:hypothetical protein
MNKINIYVVIALTVSSLLLLPAFSSPSSTPNVTISAGGTVQYSALDPRTPINKAIYIYGSGSLTDTQISFIANHFTLMDVSFEINISSLQEIKKANPNMRIIGYKDMMGVYPGEDDWAEVNSHEDWFVHAANGNRILNTFWNWYLMDVGSSGWRQHYVSYVNNQISNAQYDGVFADDVWNTIESWSSQYFNAAIPEAVISRWHNDTIEMLQYVKANLLPNKILIVNSDEWNTDDYLNVADGQMIEGYEHAPWDPVNSLGTRSSIDVLARKSATGKIVWAVSGTDTNGTSQTQIDAMMKYCYSSFLIGMNGTQAYWEWNIGDFASSYQTIMDTNIGQQTGAYYSSQSVYIRDFTSGKVLFNPSANSYNVSLEGNYQLLNGTVVSSIILAPWSGEILLSLI